MHLLDSQGTKGKTARETGQRRKQCALYTCFLSPPQAGLPKGADLDPSAVSGVSCLHTQLPSLLCLPLPLGHGYEWHQQQLSDVEWEGPWEGQSPGDSWVTGFQWTRTPDKFRPQLLPWVKTESTFPSIPAYQGLSWSRLSPRQKETEITASLEALIIWGWNPSQIFRDPWNNELSKDLIEIRWGSLKRPIKLWAFNSTFIYWTQFLFL